MVLYPTDSGTYPIIQIYCHIFPNLMVYYDRLQLPDNYNIVQSNVENKAEWYLYNSHFIECIYPSIVITKAFVSDYIYNIYFFIFIQRWIFRPSVFNSRMNSIF